MKSTAAGLALALVACSPAAKHPGDAGSNDAGPTGPWVNGYYVGYEQDLYPTDQIDWNGLTNLVVGRVVPQVDGSLDTTYDINDTDGPALAQTLIQLAHQNGKKAIAMIGGAGEQANWQSAASDAHRATLVQNLTALLTSPGYDGLDIDWEPIDPGDEPLLSALLSDLRSAAPNAILTMPVNWVNSSDPGLDSFYASAAAQLDQINVMTYGMAGAYDGWQSWHSSALHGEAEATPSSVSSSAEAYLNAGVPAAKLGVGIGFYGMCWSAPVTGPNMTIGAATVLADDDVMTFAHIMDAYYSAGAYTFDATARVPYLSFAAATGPENCTFVSYEDETSVREKSAFVKAQGLGGVIIWTINQGYRGSQTGAGKNPLLEELAQDLLH